MEITGWTSHLDTMSENQSQSQTHLSPKVMSLWNQCWRPPASAKTSWVLCINLTGNPRYLVRHYLWMFLRAFLDGINIWIGQLRKEDFGWASSNQLIRQNGWPLPQLTQNSSFKPRHQFFLTSNLNGNISSSQVLRLLVFSFETILSVLLGLQTDK